MSIGSLTYSLKEQDYRGTRFPELTVDSSHNHKHQGACPSARFADSPCDLKGNSDLLTLTWPDIIGAIHRAYLEARGVRLCYHRRQSRPVSLRLFWQPMDWARGMYLLRELLERLGPPRLLRLLDTLVHPTEQAGSVR